MAKTAQVSVHTNLVKYITVQASWNVKSYILYNFEAACPCGSCFCLLFPFSHTLLTE